MDKNTNTTWISIADAAMLLKVKPSTIIHRIQSGKLIFRTPSDAPFTNDGSPNYEVCLNSLPQKLQYQYLYLHLPTTDICSVDLAAPRSKFGNVWLEEFLDISSILHEAKLIKQHYHGTGNITIELQKLALKNGISLSTLYRLLSKPSATVISSLYTDPFFLQDHLPSSMCLWSCDLAFALTFDSQKQYSQNEIFHELEKKRDKVLCTDCPYYPRKPDGNNAASTPLCTKAKRYMIVPNHRKTVNRLLSHIPRQMILYARSGYRKWRAEYGFFVSRNRPLLINESWQGDHHKFDVFVRITVRKECKSKTYEKEIAVRPTLTAWMDSATGCIVGWVISIMPNSDTIAEAFCRAAVLTTDTPFRGLPQAVIVDCGKDYKSKLLEDCPADLLFSAPSETALDRRFAGHGLLPALGTEIHHALPYHPQSKPIERCFGTIERKWISKLPGWCHNSVAERPDGFQKVLTQLLNEKKLLTLEEFVSYFQNTILPEYHNIPDTETTIPDLPGWELSKESMSPMQKYRLLEKAKTITPDWSTICVLKMHHSSGHKVGRWGIRFKNIYYQADALAYIVNESVDILYHKVQPPFAPSSITVIHNGVFLCEAFPAEKRHLIRDSAIEVMLDSDRQSNTAHEIHAKIERIRRSSSALLPSEATSAIKGNGQLYDHTYTAVVDEELSESMESTETNESADNSEPSVSKSQIQKGLSFLFGDEFSQDI